MSIPQIVGPPTPLVGFQASPQDTNVLVTWCPSFSPYSIPVTYQVQVEGAEGRIFQTKNTNSTSLLYTPEGFCSVLNFKIHAFNRAGESNESMFTYNKLTRILHL